MKVKLSKEDRIKGFSRWAEYRAPKKGEWYLSHSGGAKAFSDFPFPGLVLTPEPTKVEDSEPKYEIVRHEVDGYDIHGETGYGRQKANGLSLSHWIDTISFAGAIYKHPNGTERAFGCVGGIYVNANSQTPNWNHSMSKRTDLATTLRPIAILEKREVK